MHRVEPVLTLRRADQDRAGAVVPDDRVARILLPVDEVARSGYAGRPVFPRALAVGVVEGVIKAPALDDLIDGHRLLVVRLGSHRDDRVILDVGPDLAVFRCRQPNTLVAPLVVEVPGSILEPGGGRAVRPGADGRSIGLPDIQRPALGPFEPVGGGQEMRDVVPPLGKHRIRAIVLDHTHVLDPGAGEDRVGRVAVPADAVARGGVSQGHGGWSVVGIAGVPQVVSAVVADEDIAAFADLAVPGVAAGAGEHRVLGDRRPGDQRPGGGIGGAAGPSSPRGNVPASAASPAAGASRISKRMRLRGMLIILNEVRAGPCGCGPATIGLGGRYIHGRRVFNVKEACFRATWRVG